MKEKTFFAVPKKGRLFETTIHYLQKAGIAHQKKDRLDISHSQSFPGLVLFFLPAKDIAHYVGQGEVDLGITGQDVVKESKVDVMEKLTFDFHNCRLSLQAPIGKYKDPSELLGKRIVTSFPNLAQKYFEELGKSKSLSHLWETDIRPVSGSVEIACQLGLADAVIDLIETGETMKQAGMEELAHVMNSKPALIINPKSAKKELIETLSNRLTGVAIAEKYVMIEYNIEKKNRHFGEKITPGQKSPTVLPLEDELWVAIKAMVLKSQANLLMDQLKAVGACDIVIYAIDNCRI